MTMLFRPCRACARIVPLRARSFVRTMSGDAAVPTYLHVAPLRDRSVLRVRGADATSFLQGLVTNDVTLLEREMRGMGQVVGDAQHSVACTEMNPTQVWQDAPSLFAAFLNPKGRIAHDVILVGVGKGEGGDEAAHVNGDDNDPAYLIDCDASAAANLLKLLRRYKLRSAVEIEQLDGEVWALCPCANSSERSGRNTAEEHDPVDGVLDGKGDGSGGADSSAGGVPALRLTASEGKHMEMLESLLASSQTGAREATDTIAGGQGSTEEWVMPLPEPPVSGIDAWATELLAAGDSDDSDDSDDSGGASDAVGPEHNAPARPHSPRAHCSSSEFSAYDPDGLPKLVRDGSEPDAVSAAASHAAMLLRWAHAQAQAPNPAQGADGDNDATLGEGAEGDTAQAQGRMLLFADPRRAIAVPGPGPETAQGPGVATAAAEVVPLGWRVFVPHTESCSSAAAIVHALASIPAVESPASLHGVERNGAGAEQLDGGGDGGGGGGGDGDGDDSPGISAPAAFTRRMDSAGTMYTSRRMLLGVPQGPTEMRGELPLEMNLVALGGVSFSKGCYIGQELTARTHFKGRLRKRCAPVVFEHGAAQIDGAAGVDAGAAGAEHVGADMLLGAAVWGGDRSDGGARKPGRSPRAAGRILGASNTAQVGLALMRLDQVLDPTLSLCPPHSEVAGEEEEAAGAAPPLRVRALMCPTHPALDGDDKQTRVRSLRPGDTLQQYK